MSLDEITAPADANPTLAEGWIVLTTDPALATQKSSPTLVRLDQLYLYGGNKTSDVFRSADQGASWQKVEVKSGWPGRNFGIGAAFGGELWVTGGENSSDSWSADPPGDNWGRNDQVAPWGPREAHCLIATRSGQFYLLGGIKDGLQQGDVWRRDGRHWSSAGGGGMAPRVWAAATEYDGKLAVLAGGTRSGLTADLQVSPDGREWIIRPAPWQPRERTAAVTLGDTLYLICGAGTFRPFTDVWALRPHTNWTKLTARAPAISHFGAVVVDDHIVIAGGLYNEAPNSTVWAYKPPPLGWSVIGQSTVAAQQLSPFTGKIDGVYWAWGGNLGGEVIRSEDGLNWRNVPNNFPPRQGMAGTVHNGMMFACGGFLGSAGYSDEVYRSRDGARWEQVATGRRWDPRVKHCMASYGGKLWVLGGYAGGREVWASSDDGATWTLMNATAFDAPVLGAVAIEFKNRLYLLGGEGGSSNVWSSADGVSWTKVTAPWPGRHGFAAAVIEGTLYVVRGGDGGGALQDTWGTADGQTWVQVASTAPVPALTSFGAITVDAGIVLFGGSDNLHGNLQVLRLLPPQAP